MEEERKRFEKSLKKVEKEIEKEEKHKHGKHKKYQHHKKDESDSCESSSSSSSSSSSCSSSSSSYDEEEAYPKKWRCDIGRKTWKRCPSQADLGFSKHIRHMNRDITLLKKPCNTIDTCCGRESSLYVNNVKTTSEMMHMIVPFADTAYRTACKDKECVRSLYPREIPLEGCACHNHNVPKMQVRGCGERMIQHKYAPQELCDDLEII
jgi:hypothetical protein